MTRPIHHPVTISSAVRRFAALVCLTLATSVFASEGHDHGGAPAASAISASPRITLHSDLFELTGIVDSGQMTVYLDRYATNEPLAGANIAFESGSDKGLASPQADGTYLIKFEGLEKPGELHLSFTVTAGQDTDLLAGELTLGDPHAHNDEADNQPWWRWSAYTAGLLVLLGVSAFSVRKRLARRALYRNPQKPQ